MDDATPYPPRPKLFSLIFSRLLRNSRIASDIGAVGCWLLHTIADQEDILRYSRAPTFWDSQLQEELGGVDQKTLARFREKCVRAGWLHYEHGRRGKAGRYFVVIPQWALGLLGANPAPELFFGTFNGNSPSQTVTDVTLSCDKVTQQVTHTALPPESTGNSPSQTGHSTPSPAPCPLTHTPELDGNSPGNLFDGKSPENRFDDQSTSGRRLNDSTAIPPESTGDSPSQTGRSDFANGTKWGHSTPTPESYPQPTPSPLSEPAQRVTEAAAELKRLAEQTEFDFGSPLSGMSPDEIANHLSALFSKGLARASIHPKTPKSRNLEGLATDGSRALSRFKTGAATASEVIDLAVRLVRGLQSS